MSEDDGGGGGKRASRKRAAETGSTPSDESVEDAADPDATEEAPANRPSGRPPRSRSSDGDGTAGSPTPPPAPDPEPEPESEPEDEPVAASASAPADDVYVWHDPAPKSGKGVAVAAVLGLLAGVLIGGLGWAAFGAEDEDDSSSTTATATGEAAEAATTSELVVQCIYPDFSACNAETIPQALSDRCFGGTTALEIPGQPEGSETQILLTVEQLADVDPTDANQSRVAGSETELVSCADVTDASGDGDSGTEAGSTTTTAVPAEG